MRRAWLAAWAFALLLAPAASAQEPTAETPADTLPADTVRLRFGWPTGFVAHVDMERARIQQADGATDSSGVSVTYTMEVEDHPDGKLVRYAGFESPVVRGLEESEMQLMQAMSSIVPAYVVSPIGELLAVEELAEMRARILEWTAEMSDTIPNDDLEGLMSDVMSEETLFALAAQEWNALVGFWIEADLEVGAAYELETDEPLPMLGNALVPFRYEFGITDRVPCNDDDEEIRCVELVLLSYPDPEEIAPLLDEFVRRIVESGGGAAEMPAFRYTDISVENEVILVTEPGTLLPHALTISRWTEMAFEVDGEEQFASDYQEQSFVYRHRRP